MTLIINIAKEAAMSAYSVQNPKTSEEDLEKFGNYVARRVRDMLSLNFKKGSHD